MGLPILECKEAFELIENGDEVEVDFETGIITDITRDLVFKSKPFPPFIQNIIDAGGLVEYTKGESL